MILSWILVQSLCNSNTGVHRKCELVQQQPIIPQAPTAALELELAALRSPLLAAAAPELAAALS